MFNGIIYNTGNVEKIIKRENGINIFLKSNLKLSKKKIGMSISCDGVCLTLISYKKKLMEFFLSKETLSRSKFKKIKKGEKINLETPLKKGQDISGHICQGHVDTTATLIKKFKKDKAYVLEFKIHGNFQKFLVNKASILINGVSLTISKIVGNKFSIWIIPHTSKLTNMADLKLKDIVNIEIDILSKYVKKFLNEK
tara:strand:- start:1555 stop:2145 length:591 start_codon:yes stop_codon:yes gene_type:complete